MHANLSVASRSVAPYNHLANLLVVVTNVVDALLISFTLSIVSLQPVQALIGHGRCLLLCSVHATPGPASIFVQHTHLAHTLRDVNYRVMTLLLSFKHV